MSNRLTKGTRFRYSPDIERLLEGGPLHERREVDLRDYQRWMFEQIIKHPRLMLGAEMGLGKTAAVLLAVSRLLRAGRIKKVLIIAPVKVAQETWPEEIATWDFSRDLDYSLIYGQEWERLEHLHRPGPQIHIINRENLVWLWRTLGARNWPYDMIVYDEASRLKAGNLETAPTKRADGSYSVPKLSEFGALERMGRFAKRIVAMTGTMSPNGLIDLWGPYYILDGGKRLGHKKTDFQNRWFTYNHYTKVRKPQPHAFQEITERIADITFTLRSDDYLQLPPLVKSERWVRLEPAVMDQYRRRQAEFMLEEHDVEAVNSGVLANKLLQLANGSVYNDDGEDVPLHDAKLDELEQIYTGQKGEPMLIAYSYQFDLARIKKRFPKFRLLGEGKNDVRDWNMGKIPAMILHPASAAHGLNLQFGGSVIVMYGLTWSLELYLQLIKRLHRSGQKDDRVILHHILARGTYDERVMKVLRQREITQDSITDVFRVPWSRVQAEMRMAA